MCQQGFYVNKAFYNAQKDISQKHNQNVCLEGRI